MDIASSQILANEVVHQANKATKAPLCLKDLVAIPQQVLHKESKLLTI